MVPPPGCPDQVTGVFDVPVTSAKKSNVAFTGTLALDGCTATLMPPVVLTVTVALPLRVGSATLVAVTVKLPVELPAVNTPPVVILPPPPGRLQVTAVLVAPVTVAVNCRV